MATPTPTQNPTRRIEYQPALDGLRGVAVLGVIAYHAGIERFQGGFLGVSTFFTLSGFLITSLLIRERAASGRVALGEFYGRRLRRLVPAALVTIVGTALLAAFIGDDSQLARLRADGLASLFHFSNWWFIAEGDSYGALFESPSFFRHFWSLAVEEQYYLLVPPFITAAMASTGRLGGRRGPAVFASVLLAMATVGLAWPMILEARGAASDRLYFGTDTRLGELTVGALLALWFVHRDQRVVRTRVGLALVTFGTVIGVAVMGAMWISAHPGDAYLYRGGLALHAALTVVVIVAAVAPSGPVRAILAVEPLRRLGVISYGVYLLHWPILLWLQSDTTLGPVGRFAVGTVITFGLARMLNRFVEMPFRRTRLMAPVRVVGMAVPASVVVAALVVTVSAVRPPRDPPIDFGAAQDTLEALIDDNTPSGGATTLPGGGDDAPPGPVVGAEAPLRLAAFGDSTALMTGLGIVQWAAANPGRIDIVRGDAKLGCGLLSGGIRRVEDRTATVPEECDGWLDDWLRVLDGNELDVAVVQLGAWEITDHQRRPGGPFESIDDPDYRAAQVEQLDIMIAALHEQADVVALLLHPDVGEGRVAGLPVGVSYPEYDPARAAQWRELLADAAERATAASNPTITVDLAGWIDARTDDVRLRPDGVHFSQDTSIEVAEWLVPEIVRLVRLSHDAGVGRPGGPGTSTTTTTTTTTRPAPEPVRVLLAGDSLMFDSVPPIQAVFATSSAPAAEVVSEFRLQPARARTDEHRADWEQWVEAWAPDIVVEYLGYWETLAANLGEPQVVEQGFAEAYRAAILQPWFDHLEGLDADVVVLAAAPTGNPQVDRLAEIVIAAVDAEAAGRPRVTVLHTADVLAPDGHTEFLPDPRTGEVERVRRIDGLHLCPDGGELVADLLVAHLESAYPGRFGFDPDPEATGWRAGDWRVALPIDLARDCPAP